LSRQEAINYQKFIGVGSRGSGETGSAKLGDQNKTGQCEEKGAAYLAKIGVLHGRSTSGALFLQKYVRRPARFLQKIQNQLL
jgi:hypothetical protein